MYTYAAHFVVDQVTGRALAGVRVAVEDAETGLPVQAYRDGVPVSLVTGPNGLIPEWQTDENTRRVALTAGPVRLTRWCEELPGIAADAVSLMDDRLTNAVAAASQAATIRDGLEPRVQTVEARQTALESAAGFGPSTPEDGTTASYVLQPGSETRGALEGVISSREPATPLATLGVSPDSADNGSSFTSALTEAARTGRRLIGQPGAVYRVASNVLVPIPEGGTLDLDLNGATIALSAGAWMRLGTQAPTAYLTTTAPAGVTRKGTSVAVTSADGVRVGDLMSIVSPVEEVPGIAMRQTYIVADVDTSAGRVWVEGRIVGDMTPAQIADAGKTGDVQVRFYRLASRVSLRNGVLTSPARDAGDNLVVVGGVRDVDLDSLSVDTPTRTGVNTVYCGTVRAANTTASRYGYATRDDGYSNNVPGAPGGLAFGYGFVYSDCYSVRIHAATGHPGWHSHDVAGGVSYGLWDGLVSHRGAYGASTHEGAWVMEVRNSAFHGGQGITCRAHELIVDSCRIDTSLGEAIIFGGPLQRLHLRNVVMDIGTVRSVGGALNIAPQARPGLRSAAPADVILDGLHITGATATSTIRVPGNLIVRDVTVSTPGTTGTSELHLIAETAGQGRLLIQGCASGDSPAQFVYRATGWAQIDMIDTHHTGTVGAPNNSALLYVLGENAPRVRAESCTSTAHQYIVRAEGTSAAIETHGCAATRMVLAGSGETYQAATSCRTTQAALMLGGVAAPTVTSGNVVVPA